MFIDKGWYSPEKAYGYYHTENCALSKDNNKFVAERLPKEANLSLGRHYRRISNNYEHKKEFLSFLYNLSFGKNQNNVDRCLFIIKHTIVNYEHDRIDNEIKALLQKIVKVNKNAFLVKKHYHFLAKQHIIKP
jgi:hypothetical protein